MIGTNNLPHDTESQVIEGVKVVINRVRLRLPASKVLLLGVTPRGLNYDLNQTTATADPRVASLNLGLARLADGQAVTFLDFGPALLDEGGRINKAIEPDFLHLSIEGYRIWAEAMEPTLARLMAGK